MARNLQADLDLLSSVGYIPEQAAVRTKAPKRVPAAQNRKVDVLARIFSKANWDFGIPGPGMIPGTRFPKYIQNALGSSAFMLDPTLLDEEEKGVFRGLLEEGDRETETRLMEKRAAEEMAQKGRR